MTEELEAQSIALIDNGPFNVIGAGSIVGIAWMALMMAWSPIPTSFLTGTDDAMSFMVVPVRDFGMLYGTNILYTSYLITFIFYGTICIPTFGLWIAVMAGMNPSFFMYFTEYYAQWAAYFGTMAPPAMAIVGFFTGLMDPVEFVLLLLARLFVAFAGFFMWLTMMLIYAINTGPMV